MLQKRTESETQSTCQRLIELEHDMFARAAQRNNPPTAHENSADHTAVDNAVVDGATALPLSPAGQQHQLHHLSVQHDQHHSQMLANGEASSDFSISASSIPFGD